jgi:hypothetical protein
MKKQMLQLASWLLLPVFILLVAIYGLMVWMFRVLGSGTDRLEKFIDRLVDFNDDKLMGKR